MIVAIEYSDKQHFCDSIFSYYLMVLLLLPNPKISISANVWYFDNQNHDTFYHPYGYQCEKVHTSLFTVSKFGIQGPKGRQLFMIM